MDSLSPVTSRDLLARAVTLSETFADNFQLPCGCKLRPRFELSKRMMRSLGMAHLFEGSIQLAERYFRERPTYLAHTVFHELTHHWLYLSGRDPSHTPAFYRKMAEFRQFGLPLDPEMHEHQRLQPESRYGYYCETCLNRWFFRKPPAEPIFCGWCYAQQTDQLRGSKREMHLGEQREKRWVKMADPQELIEIAKACCHNRALNARCDQLASA